MKSEFLNYLKLLQFFYQQLYVTNTHICRDRLWCTCARTFLCCSSSRLLYLTQGS